MLNGLSAWKKKKNEKKDKKKEKKTGQFQIVYMLTAIMVSFLFLFGSMTILSSSLPKGDNKFVYNFRKHNHWTFCILL